MRTSINPIEKQAQKIAFRFLYSIDHILLNKDFPRNGSRLDMRFNVNKLAAIYIRKMRLSENEIYRIRELQKNRAISRHYTRQGNVLSNPIVKDYLANKNYLKSVENDHLSFIGYRNHWAKNETDLKILAILKKHFDSK